MVVAMAVVMEVVVGNREVVVGNSHRSGHRSATTHY